MLNLNQDKNEDGEDEIKDGRNQSTLTIERELARSSMGEYTAKRQENKRGMWLDLFGMLFIIVMGLITVFGVFESNLALLVLLISLVFAAPIIHFFFQMKSVKAVNP